MNSYDKLERLPLTQRQTMHPNTKVAIDGIWECGKEMGMVDLAINVSCMPQEMAELMAQSMEMCADDPLTPAQRKAVAAELRSGVADDYIAGLLGYV